MSDGKNLSASECGKRKCMACNGASNVVYGLGFVGAAIYYLQHATTFWAGAFGILKAVAWPAFVVYKLLEFLGM